MRIEINPAVSGGETLVVTLSHGTRSSTWNVRAYVTNRTPERRAQLTTEAMFQEINSYWESLPMERQNGIWQVYHDIRELFDSNFNVNNAHSFDISTIRQRLIRLCRRLYEQMPFEEVLRWVHRLNPRIPDSVLESHQVEGHGEDSTYLTKDYYDLMTLAVMMRPMMPIWGEYLKTSTDETGTQFKELSAMGLLYETHVIQSEAVDRLRIYIRAMLQQMPDFERSDAATLEGLGTAELPDFLLAMTLVRRLTIAEIPARPENPHLISNIYNFISSQVKQLDRRFKGKPIKHKKPQEDLNENKDSVLESNKITQEVADGSIVSINTYTERFIDMAIAIDPSIPLNLVQECMDCIHSRPVFVVEAHHRAFAQWVMKPCISPRGIPLLNKQALLRVLAVTQALLWHWRYYDLAALVTAIPLVAQSEKMWRQESRDKVSPPLRDQLQARFPYRRIERKSGNEFSHNPASKSIEAMCKLLVDFEWSLHVPPSLLELTSRHPNSRRLSAPPNIRDQLAQLILQISQ